MIHHAVALFHHAISSSSKIHRLKYAVFKRFCLMKSIVCLALLIGGFGFAMEWPDESDRILSTFGAANNGHYQRGLAFKSEGQLVSSWGAGEIIWADDAQNQISSRGIVVVEHQNGFRSVYLGIERLHNLGLRLAAGQWLGYARGETWRFEIVDAKRSKLVNPVFILPARSESPLHATGMLEVLMSGGAISIQDASVLSAGHQTIVVNDVFPDGNGTVPAEISLYWIAQRIAELRINALRESENGIVLETPKPLPYESVFSPSGQIWFSNIRLDEGRGELELRIEDEAGRVFIRSWEISVR